MADTKGSALPVVTPTAGDRAIGVDDPLATTASVGFLTEDLNPNIDINKITLFNNIQTIQTVILYVRRKFGAFRKLRQYVLMQNQSAEYLIAGEHLFLEAGDVLEAETTTADAVDFVVYGTLE